MNATENVTKTYYCTDCGVKLGYPSDLCAKCEDARYPQSGSCEDFPCCGHESGDCFGQKYGSDASIIADTYRRMRYEDDYGYGYYEADENYLDY